MFGFEPADFDFFPDILPDISGLEESHVVF
jgi:hypothetical protein